MFRGGVSMIRVVAIDIDGTLITTDGALPARNRAALTEATRGGILLVLATARSVTGAVEILESLELSGALITELGATVLDLDGTIIAAHRFSEVEAKGIVDDFTTAAFHFIGTTEGINYESSDSLGARSGVRRKLDSASFDYSKVSRFVVRNASLDAVQEVVGQRAVELYVGAVAPGGKQDVILVPRGVSKGGGLAALCEHRGIDRAEVLAIGDSSTDIELIEWAGYGVAVADGDASLKAKATWIAPPAASGGVAEALLHFELIGP